ncbi:hypothetical protein GCM10022240_28350 [Microbacterium kribbense]|uniref:Uncharacterized protein n=1 Tax=Microbacterium kribbense TaxID=433645 RepID=A0ABP7GSQ7_9MICO
MTDDQLSGPTEDSAADASAPVDPVDENRVAAASQYGVGPFSLREVIMGGVLIAAFVVSFFSTATFAFTSVWTNGISWILTIGVPIVAVFLVILRRLSPSGIRRVGSLGVDQFASVAFSVAAVVWLTQLWAQVSGAISNGPWVLSWVPWVEFVLMLAGVVLTVFAGLIPGLAEDFAQRPESVAHRVARAARPVTARPPRPVTARAPHAQAAADTVYAAPADQGGHGDGGLASLIDAAPPAAVPEAEPAAPAQQAFWALVPEERDVVDENGVPLFRIGPSAWALVIEDRGTSFVVRHEDGRVGVLNDTSEVTRG